MKKSFICIAILLLSASLYAQPMLSYGGSLGYVSTTTESYIPENDDGKMSQLYIDLGLEFSYAIENGLTFGARLAGLVGLVGLRKSHDEALPFTSFGLGYNAGLGIGYTYTSKHPFKLSVLVFPVTISYLYAIDKYDDTSTGLYRSVEEKRSIMDYATGIQFSFSRLNHSKKFGSTWSIGLDLKWGQQTATKLKDADFDKQLGVGVFLSWKRTNIF